MKTNFLLILLFSFLPVIHFAAFCQTEASNASIGFIEKQGEYVALDTKLINEQGDTVILRDVLDRPTILSLVYYRCPGTCSPLMWGIAKFIDQVDLKPGEDYQILTVSFDPTENIQLGIDKKANYVTSMQKKELASGWHFYVSDSANIAKLTESVGFRYKWIQGQYTHPTGLIALAADGKITRYLRGIEFLPFDIKITMVEAADGKVGPSINRLLAMCYSYDKEGNQFVFNITRVSGAIIIFLGIVIFLILVFLRRKKT